MTKMIPLDQVYKIPHDQEPVAGGLRNINPSSIS